MESRKIYPSLDIAKFVMAMLILTQHTSNEWAHSTGLVHAFFGLGNFAVPFFFACSGFLFFSKLNLLNKEEQKAYYKKWSFRIGKMYLVWSAIYFCFVLIGWARHGFDIESIIDWVHEALVYTTYATIWFLPALWVGVTICYLMKSYCSSWLIVLTMIALLTIGNLFGSYTQVITQTPVLATIHDWYMDVFITWRNGVFNGAPFVAIGLFIASGGGKKLTMPLSLLLTVLFCGAFILEAFIIIRYHFSNATDQGFMMFPAIFFMMLFLVKCEVKEKTIWRHCRNLSMLVFLGQRLFLTAIPGVLPTSYKAMVTAWPEPFIYLYFVSSVLAFAIVIERLSDKYPKLKILW